MALKISETKISLIYGSLTVFLKTILLFFQKSINDDLIL